jgi:hypothetical protein
MFGQPKKAKELGKPRNEAERKRVNKRLKKKYGYEEHFKAPKGSKGSARTQSISAQLKDAGITEDEMPNDKQREWRKNR